MYELIVFLPLLGSLIAGLFGSNLFRMIGSEATAFAHEAAQNVNILELLAFRVLIPEIEGTEQLFHFRLVIQIGEGTQPAIHILPRGNLLFGLLGRFDLLSAPGSIQLLQKVQTTEHGTVPAASRLLKAMIIRNHCQLFGRRMVVD